MWATSFQREGDVLKRAFPLIQVLKTSDTPNLPQSLYGKGGFESQYLYFILTGHNLNLSGGTTYFISFFVQKASSHSVAKLSKKYNPSIACWCCTVV